MPVALGINYTDSGVKLNIAAEQTPEQTLAVIGDLMSAVKELEEERKFGEEAGLPRTPRKGQHFGEEPRQSRGVALQDGRHIEGP